MKEYLSPGIYTQEFDNSVLEVETPIEPSAVFIGGFTKGRAFVPMLIQNTNDLIAKTGQPNGIFYAQYAALEYSKNKQNFYVQRMLWNEQWEPTAYIIYAHNSDKSSGSVLAILVGNNLTGVTVTSASGAQGDELDNKYVVINYTMSGVGNSFSKSVKEILNIEKYIPETPAYNNPFYLYCKAQDYTSSTQFGAGQTTVSVQTASKFISINGYQNARTPSIYNEQGNELFHFEHLSDGNYTNRDIKIAIENINTESQYTVFDVIVRDYYDNDKQPKILQSFTKVNLNPTDEDYIARRIGDIYYEYNNSTKKIITKGDYANKSSYIRVVVSDLVKQKGIASNCNVNVVQRCRYYTGSNAYTLDYPDIAHTTTSGTTFNHCGYNTALWEIRALSNPISKNIDISNLPKDTFNGDYIIPFYGGFDGCNPFKDYSTGDNRFNGYDFSDTTSTTASFNKFKQAIQLFGNADEYNIDVISIPGLHIGTENMRKLLQYSLEICESRGECIIVADAGKINDYDVSSVIQNTKYFDSSFGAVYYPAVKINCIYTNTLPIIPASTYIPAVLAYTERISQPFYAPAGISRGSLNVIAPVIKLNQSDRDLLYSHNINPIASFPGQGTVVWGQKTLQQKRSALDRVNVRILINRIKKWIESYGRTVLFNNNTVNLRVIFKQNVDGYLSDIVMKNGLYAFEFIMDDTLNTADVIDRNQLIGQVKLWPTKSAEYIIIPISIEKTSTMPK